MKAQIPVFINLYRGGAAIVLGILLLFIPNRSGGLLLNLMGFFWLSIGFSALRRTQADERNPGQRTIVIAGFVGILAGIVVITRQFTRQGCRRRQEKGGRLFRGPPTRHWRGRRRRYHPTAEQEPGQRFATRQARRSPAWRREAGRQAQFRHARQRRETVRRRNRHRSGRQRQFIGGTQRWQQSGPGQR